MAIKLFLWLPLGKQILIRSSFLNPNTDKKLESRITKSFGLQIGTHTYQPDPLLSEGSFSDPRKYGSTMLLCNIMIVQYVYTLYMDADILLGSSLYIHY